MQLIDAGQLFRKLRKNLGNKNCELTPVYIREIVNAYEQLAFIDRQDDDGIASKVFDNADFGYYKVTIERLERLKAQFTEDRIEALRFDKTLREPMRWAYAEFGEDVYTDIKKHTKTIHEWCEKNDLNLNAKKTKALTDPELWNKGIEFVEFGKGFNESNRPG